MDVFPWSSVDQLVRDLSHSDDEKRADAAAAIAGVDPSDGIVITAVREAGGIEALVALVEGGTALHKEEAALALAALSCDAASRVAIRKAQGISPLIRLLGDSPGTSEPQQEYAAAALAALASDTDSIVAIAEAGGIPPLVSLVSRGTDRQKERAALALAHLAAADADCAQVLHDVGGIQALAALLRASSGVQSEMGALALGSLANHVRIRNALIEADTILPLVALLREGTERQKEEAACAFANLLQGPNDEPTLMKIEKAGGLTALVRLTRTGNEVQKQYAAAALLPFAYKAKYVAAIHGVDTEGLVHLSSAVRNALMANGADEATDGGDSTMTSVVSASMIAPDTGAVVPKKIDALFDEVDTNSDGKVSLEELTDALEKAFPDMKAWAKAHIPLQWKKYAGEGADAGLDKRSFSKVYAAFLFRYFDENQDGALQASEAEAALKYLADGKPTAVAIPVGKDGTVTKLDFWLMFQAMMQ